MRYYDPKRLLTKEELRAIRRGDSDETGRIDFVSNIVEDLEDCIPKDIGEMLVKENNSKDYKIYIHRSSFQEAEYFFKNGLPNAGGSSLSYTMSAYDENLSLLLNVKHASRYKNPKNNDAVCLIIKIPREYLEYTPGKTKPILFLTDEMAEDGGGIAFKPDEKKTVLLSEFIMGAITYSNHEITGFVSNPNYRDTHDYQNNGLVCPEETIDSFLEQNPNFALEISYDERAKQANKVVCEENTGYMKGMSPMRDESDVINFSLSGILPHVFENAMWILKGLFKSKEIDDDRGKE